ncbi:c-type cytochrome [Hirschia baltica]|uniref:Cytochrome c class I n=1 Tax=Hirschia baltica (strain ATCC 49814 / DSM 5838 / IFAM 1418) TaxID=582402 RepID=C6XQB6_HIRBI|nr:cytochrome c family protein [Hirschia baltica]ACT60415.1 cytochrome c class I [Hirschia baltica ATCC 49814]
MRIPTLPKISFVLATCTLATFAPTLSVAHADVEKGEKLFKLQCAVCHYVEPAKTKMGPSLFGIVGSKSASSEGFRYSPAMKEAGLTWDAQTLDEFLASPRKAVPRTSMAFVGQKSEEKRADLIAYLETLK